MDCTNDDRPAPAKSLLAKMREHFLSPWGLVLTIATVLFALYPGVVLGNNTFFFQDYGLFTYPVAHYIRESFWNGEIPLWNPLINCGVPFLAQWNTGVLYPLSVFYLIFPLPWSLNVFLLGHLIIAGLGMYYLAHHWTQNQLAAFVAGLAFGLNGLMLNCLLWTSNLAALAWQPWVVLFVGYAWREGGLRRLSLAALVAGIQMLSGAPEIIIFTWTIILALWLVEVVRSRKGFWVGWRRLSVLVILVSGLAAVQLLPLFELIRHSDRGLSYEYANAWPLPLWGVANFFVPQVHALQSVLGTYQLADQFWTKSYYPGIGVLLLVFVGAGRVKNRYFWVLAAGGLLAMLLAFGSEGKIYDWVKQVFPFISFARYPVKFISATVFVLPLLAAFTINSFRLDKDDNGRRVLLVAGGLVIVAIVVSLWGASLHLREQENRGIMLRDGLTRLAFLAGIVLVSWGWLRAKKDQLRKKWGLALVGLMTLDLATAGLRMHPVTTTRVFGPLELNMAQRPVLGGSRTFLFKKTETLLDYVRVVDLVAYNVVIRGAMAQNYNLLENIPKVNGFSSLRIKEQVEVGGLIDRDNNELVGPLADFLGVSQVLFPDKLYEWQARTNVLPLVTAGQRPVFADQETTLRVLASDEFAPKREVYLPLESQGRISVAGHADAQILEPKYAAHKITFTVETDAPTVAVIAQTFYPNWRATVDGKPVPLWRANHAFQALEVPAGRQEVVLTYQDTNFKIGAVISGITWVGCLVGLVGFSSTNRRKRRL